MKRSSLFGHIAELHETAKGSPLPADRVAKDFFRGRRYLGSADRRFISEAFYGMLRHARLLDACATAAVRSLGVPAAATTRPSLMMAVTYLVRFGGINREELVPDVAGLWRRDIPGIDCDAFLASLVSVSLEELEGEDPAGRIAVLHSIPDALAEEWVRRFGAEEAGELCAALNRPAPVTIRVNALVSSVQRCREELLAEGHQTEPTPLSPDGLKFPQRINVQGLATYKRGFFEMQDEGSQLISRLVAPEPGMTVVDACAGSGGKSLHLAALMQNKGSVVSIDVDAARLRKIKERLERGKASIVTPLLAGKNAGRIAALHRAADAVLVDAPCTGVGTYRRNPGAKWLFSEEFLGRCLRVQQNVLQEYAPLVRQGGVLVYSTCSLLRGENEDQAERFLQHHPAFELISATEVLSTQGIRVESTSPYLLLTPHRTATDGFFAAVMRRTR